MGDFAKENLNVSDYQSLNDMYARQLECYGWTRSYGKLTDGDENQEYGMGYRAPNSDPDAPVQNLYDAWASATGTPTDLKFGIEKEPPAAGYRKPV